MEKYGNITVLIYSSVLTEYNTLNRFVTKQWDGLCKQKKEKRGRIAGILCVFTLTSRKN